jgi:hypothetical protein
VQVIGVGALDSFEDVQTFLNRTGMTDTMMLWESKGNLWRLQNVSHNSSMQLYSYDLSKESGVIFFNDQGRKIVLESAGVSPWAPGASIEDS